MKFEKPPKTSEQHLNLLKERGLQIDDPERFYRYSKTISYYRLTGYMYPFQLADGSHTFKSPVTFDIILEHYLFDKRLRLLLLHEIERLEISFRTTICNVYALKFGSLKPRIPSRKNFRFLDAIDHETDKRLYGILSCMVFLNSRISPKSKFKERLKQLFKDHPNVNKGYMGFAADWEKEPLWQS